MVRWGAWITTAAMISGYHIFAPAAKAQLTVRDSAEVALEAVRYLRTSEKAASWSRDFPNAAKSDVIAAGKLLTKADSNPAILARIQGGPERFDTFTRPGLGWSCERPASFGTEKTLIGRCALAQAKYYAHVGELTVKGAAVLVNVTLLMKDESLAGGYRWLDTLVQLVRDGERWRGERVVVVEM